MKVVLYLRVSTTDQDPESQGREVRAFVAAHGWAFFTLAAMFAELERSMLIERVRAGMARARAEGKKIGRPTRAMDLRLLQCLRAEGHSIRQIARRLEVPSSTVAKRLEILK